MMHKRKHISWITGTAVLAMLAAGLPNAAAQAVGYIVKKGSGQRIQGTIKWKASTKQYEIKRGAAITPIPFKQVAEVRVKPPAGLVDAVKKVRAGSFSGPHVIALDKIVKEYAMLQHDITAGQWLITSYLGTGRAEDAYKIGRGIMVNREKSQLSGGFVSAWLKVLLETERYATLEAELKKLIETGSRPAAASAQLMRGEIDKRKGNFRHALVGGFLRTIVLFADIGAVQPEALYKAAQCFEELGETPNAEKMRQKLLADYPRSEYSRKL